MMSNKSPREYVLASALDLIEFLKIIYDQCTREGKWKGKIILLPCDLDGLYYLGWGSSRIYISRGGRVHNLRGIFPREFLPLFWKISLKVQAGPVLWIFDAYGSGPFTQRFQEIEDGLLSCAVEELLQKFLQDRAKVREAIIPLADGTQPPWKTCSICNPIPDNSFGFWKGGNLESGGMPPMKITWRL